MAKTHLMVRAVLAEAADRPRFDRWYETEHMPEAVAAFGALRGWRCWSLTDPTVHYAFYEFADAGKAEAIQDSPGMAGLIAEFDRVWGDRVTRRRITMEVAGEFTPGQG
ncbi:hypothetical protein GCM10011504_09090 [Siccirubricoccus deserti]|uniref:EthD family reductase n=1 Tax=Siccirubricoccus deserti TaxID=2013562 RepID=A0A9X0QUZ2_9PROT|nr:hypothetical protein [Siccirubricoccus deserti]MBC4014416.1 hypothetical protein [Siccirubricoccus deserti]GGC33025.1 hypothetical protein GCM10011504_09090 [Siccirubricoccus deserti]